MQKGLRPHPRAHHLHCEHPRTAGRGLGVLFVVSAIMLGAVIAPLTASAGSLSERFPSDSNYPNGTLVSIQQTVPTSVDLADLTNADFLVGVVESEGQSLLTISREQGDLTVALSGEVEIFVSDINGPIEQGDFIGNSWIRGVGMKALENTDQKLLGIALESFDESDDDAYEVSDIDTPDGRKDAKIAKIALRIFDRQVGPNSTLDDTTFLEEFAARVAGKQVVFARILAAAVMFIVSAVISAVFLANAIRGSFISLGRNPLASGSIYTNLIQVSGVAMGVILIGTVLAYVVLII
ncbi:MAG: hypothetical protein R3313_02715 [Candidatus Saccharimonadales bacterium]|nr:hypothetical protein [Candidatus Saccharimonadales bacterium]